MSMSAPSARQVKVRDTSTGQVFHAWPVDARELVTPGSQYEYATPETPLGAPNAPAPVVAPARTIAEQLAERSYKELQTLAKRAGLNPNQKGVALVDALTPLVDAGTVSLEELPPLALPAVQFPHATVE